MWLSSIEYQKRYNISPQLFYLWRTTGKLQTKELVKNHHLVWVEDEPNNNPRVVAVYGRVSTSKQKQDLSNQIDVLKKYVINEFKHCNYELIGIDDNPTKTKIKLNRYQKI